MEICRTLQQNDDAWAFIKNKGDISQIIYN